MQTFEKENTIFTENDSVKDVLQEDKNVRVLIWGQLKLIMTELQFLTLYWNPQRFPNPIVIVPGGAPGHSYVILSELFPDISFHLYDPLFKKETGYDTRLREHKNVEISDKLFEHEDIEFYIKEKDRGLYLMSDIRNPNWSDEDVKGIAKKQEELIMDDNAKMREWVEHLRPEYAHLKFKTPPITGDREYNYLSGVLFKQPFIKKDSGETRLVVEKPEEDCPYETITWNRSTYQLMTKYHNAYGRGKTRYCNLLDNSDGPMWLEQYTGDYDSTYMAWIILQYFEKVRVEKTEDNLIGMTKYIIHGLQEGKMPNAFHTLQRIRRDTNRLEPSIPKQEQKQRQMKESTRAAKS